MFKWKEVDYIDGTLSHYEAIVFDGLLDLTVEPLHGYWLVTLSTNTKEAAHVIAHHRLLSGDANTAKACAEYYYRHWLVRELKKAGWSE